MHDPMVVAFQIPSPIPHRVKWREHGGKRWGFDVSRRTNAENLGELTYRWWRLKGYTLRLAGRAYQLGRIATIWHVEPNEHDAFEVCGRDSHWRWHVHHWRIQVHLEQCVRRFLLERCELCGRRYPWGYAPVAHSWDSPRTRWRDGVVRSAYHHECSTAVTQKQTIATDERLIAALFAAYRVSHDLDEPEALTRLTDPTKRAMAFGDAYRLVRILGYERDDGYRLVKR